MGREDGGVVMMYMVKKSVQQKCHYLPGAYPEFYVEERWEFDIDICLYGNHMNVVCIRKEITCVIVKFQYYVHSSE